MLSKIWFVFFVKKQQKKEKQTEILVIYKKNKNEQNNVSWKTVCMVYTLQYSLFGGFW